MLRSDLCNFNEAFIVIKGAITVEGANVYNQADGKVIFNNNAPFMSCMSKINNTLVDNAEDLDIVILLYNVLEYSQNYSMTSGSLWNYNRDELNDDGNYNRDELNDDGNESKADNYRINNNKIKI